MDNINKPDISAKDLKFTFLPIQYIASKHPQLFQHLKARGYTTYNYLYILMEVPSLALSKLLTFQPGSLLYLISEQDFSLHPVADPIVRNGCHVEVIWAISTAHPEYQTGYTQCFATRSDGRIQPLF